MARPKNRQPKHILRLRATPKLVAYLDQIVDLQGFGDTRQDVIKRLVWDGINDLLAKKRLK